MSTSLVCSPRQAKARTTSGVDQADKACQQYIHQLDLAYQQTEPHLYRALAAIYRVCVEFDTDPTGRDEFLRSRDIQPHGGAENPYQPLVKAFLIQGESRERITVYAGAIAEAIRNKIKPSGFPSWIKSTTIKLAYREYCKTKRLPEAVCARARALNARVDQALSGDEPMLLPEHPKLIRQHGRYIGVIQVDQTGAHLVRVLDNLTQHQVRSVILMGACDDQG